MRGAFEHARAAVVIFMRWVCGHEPLKCPCCIDIHVHVAHDPLLACRLRLDTVLLGERCIPLPAPDPFPSQTSVGSLRE